MTVEELEPVMVERLRSGGDRPHIWYWNDQAAWKDLVRSAQNCADQSGDPQYIVNRVKGTRNFDLCTHWVLSDTRRALAINPRRFMKPQEDETVQEYTIPDMRETPSSSGGAGDGA